jgi:hypothetical protein
MPALDMARERKLAGLLLASQDMTNVIFSMLKLWSEKDDSPATMHASVEILATYCRPFLENARRERIGEKWIEAYTPDEMALHTQAIRLRHNHLAHTDGDPTRVRIHIQSAPSSRPITYSPQTGIGGFSLEQMRTLRAMVDKIRAQIEKEKQSIEQDVLRGRIAAGYLRAFTLGKEYREERT